MKIYVHEKGITLAGKAWKVKQKLKEYGKHYMYVNDWIETTNHNNHPNLSYHKASHIITNNDRMSALKRHFESNSLRRICARIFSSSLDDGQDVLVRRKPQDVAF